MQPSKDEIQREVEALRDIKRRSTAQGGPGALLLDPDLPSPSSTSSTSSAHWPSGSTSPDDSSSSSSSSHDSSSGKSSAGDDPFHLFWVPANVHPEIAPDQFRAFLKEHARGPGDGLAPMSRSNSTSSARGLDRKRSMLSKQYKPREDDGVEEEERVVPLRRNRSSYYANSGPHLTISDLQKLEELAEEASKSDDPTRLRSVLRRSLSLNVAPSVIDQMDDMPGVNMDDADAPIIVPPPGQILRRSARTKIRKAGTSGEGSHRFNATRRRVSGGQGRSNTLDSTRSSSDMSSNDHGDSDILGRPRRLTNEVIEAASKRPESYSVETSIFDAYVTEEPVPVPEGPLIITSPPPPMAPEDSKESTYRQDAEAQLSPPAEEAPTLYHPQPKRVVVPPATPEAPARTPSPPSEQVSTTPIEPVVALTPRPPLAEAPPFAPPVPERTPSPSNQRKDKDQSGLFGTWGGDKDKSSKKGGKEKDRENRDQREKKEKKAGFFGSLFGGKKKQEESPPSSLGHSAGREAAVALLGASRSSKSPTPSPTPSYAGAYARYPIHVERAIYRLSHIKLANPRRPLYEQVLISNLMFWYLGVINKTQTQGPAAGQPQAAGQGQQPSPTAAAEDKETMEREKTEQEERERVERERIEKEREREKELKTQPRRGTLNKAQPPPGPQGRRAEMPVRGPQYEMQHRAMEQEYVGGGQPGYNANPGPPPRTSSAAPGPYQPYPSHKYSQSADQAQPQIPNNFYYDAGTNGDASTHHRSVSTPQRPSVQLPPGAMPPVSADHSWLNNAAPRSSSSPSPPPGSPNPPGHPGRQSRSPPPQNRYTPVQEHQQGHGDGGHAGKPTRSASAQAASAAAPQPAPNVNGKIRKVSSAHATVPINHGPKRSSSGGEEDVPLALYQQQQQRRR